MSKATPISEMAKFHFGNTIFCIDGEGGILANVIFDGSTRRVTHLGVKQGRLFGKIRYLPFESVISAAGDGVRVKANRAELVAAGKAPSPAVLLYADAAHFGGGGSANQGWGGKKVLWFVDARYQGYVLVRGHQIDGPHGMRFQTSLDPQLVINTADGGTPWPNMPSYTRLQAPGCYAYQVDGTAFSYEIIFQATLGGF